MAGPSCRWSCRRRWTARRGFHPGGPRWGSAVGSRCCWSCRRCLCWPQWCCCSKRKENTWGQAIITDCIKPLMSLMSNVLDCWGVNYCFSLIAFVYWEMLLAKISPACRMFTYFKHWKDVKSVLRKMSLAWRLTRSKQWKQLFKAWPFGCGPNLEVNDADAVGDERNGLHPVVSQQQVPQLAHFLAQIQIIAQVSFVLGYCLFEHILWQCFCVFLWEGFGFVPLSEGVSLLVLKVVVNVKCKVMAGTLKALALTPLVWRRFLLALKYISLSGSMGRLTSLFSERFRSSRRVSLEKAPSSISEILFPVRSILFRVTVDRWVEDTMKLCLLLLCQNLKASNEAC